MHAPCCPLNSAFIFRPISVTRAPLTMCGDRMEAAEGGGLAPPGADASFVLLALTPRVFCASLSATDVTTGSTESTVHVIHSACASGTAVTGVTTRCTVAEVVAEVVIGTGVARAASRTSNERPVPTSFACFWPFARTSNERPVPTSFACFWPCRCPVRPEKSTINQMGLNPLYAGSRRVLVGTPSTIPQTHVFWLGPPAPIGTYRCWGKYISNPDCVPF